MLVFSVLNFPRCRAKIFSGIQMVFSVSSSEGKFELGHTLTVGQAVSMAIKHGSVSSGGTARLLYGVESAVSNKTAPRPAARPAAAPRPRPAPLDDPDACAARETAARASAATNEFVKLQTLKANAGVQLVLRQWSREPTIEHLTNIFCSLASGRPEQQATLALINESQLEFKELTDEVQANRTTKKMKTASR